jgi:hypothetical protein
MESNATTTESASSETPRRTTICTCRRPSEGLLPKHRAALVPRAETSMGHTMPGLPADPRQPVTRYASLITLRGSATHNALFFAFTRLAAMAAHSHDQVFGYPGPRKADTLNLTPSTLECSSKRTS